MAVLFVWLPSQAAPFTGPDGKVDFVVMYKQLPFAKLAGFAGFLFSLVGVAGLATLIVGFVLPER